MSRNMYSRFLQSLLVVFFTFLITSQSLGQSTNLRVADSLYSIGAFAKALPIYEKTIVVHPDDPFIYSKMGFCLYRLGKVELAIKNYEKALENKMPSGPRGKAVVNIRLAKAYAKFNDFNNAQRYIDSALANNYSDLKDFESAEEFAGLKNSKRYKEQHETLIKGAYPCTLNLKKRQFDFWVGEWDVTNTANQPAGKSIIQKISGDCAILENWISIGTTYEGKSVNYYSDDKDRWEQIWMGSQGEVKPSLMGEYTFYQSISSPTYKGEAMVFKIKDKDAKGDFIANFVFFNKAPDKVKQFQERSYDGGNTWVVSLDLDYSRTK